MSGNSQWRDGFVCKLDGLRSQWVDDFKHRVTSEVVPAFDEIAAFVAEHGFRASSPVTQPDRQSFKFEMAENAFVLLTLSHESIGDVLLRCEYFAPGAQPGDLVHHAQVQDLSREWATARFQEALDAFVAALGTGGGDNVSEPVDLELLSV